MDIIKAASFFDRAVASDGYTGRSLFKAQIGLYDDTKRDSEASERRIISVAAGVTPPARRVVAVNGYRFIMGKPNPDFAFGKVIRLGYVAQEAPNLTRVRSLGQVCLGAAGVEAYTGYAWVKNAAFTEQSSDLAAQFHVFFGLSEAVAAGQILTFGGSNYIVRSVNQTPADMLAALVEKTPDSSTESATLTSGYSPVTGSFTGTPTTVQILRLRWQSWFTYGNKAKQPFGPDDIQLVVAKASYTPTPGTRVTLADGSWLVASVQPEEDAWVCRATKHAGA